jgi:isocitrate dehydrogenase
MGGRLAVGKINAFRSRLPRSPPPSLELPLLLPPTATALADRLEGGSLELKMIANRGVKVWLGSLPETFCTDHGRCRVMKGDGSIDLNEILALGDRVVVAGVDFIKFEHLCTFDGEAGFTLGQGQ